MAHDLEKCDQGGWDSGASLVELAASAASSLLELGFFVVTELRPGLRSYGYGMHWDTHCVCCWVFDI